MREQHCAVLARVENNSFKKLLTHPTTQNKMFYGQPCA